MRLVLLGPPGAGKGSFAQHVRDRWRLAHIASGDLLREAVRAKTPLGVEAERDMTRGELVPDALVTALIRERVAGLAEGQGFVLDGFPRTEPQAVALDAALREAGAPLDRVVYLKTTPAVITGRLAGRRVCAACGQNYHVTNRPSRREGVCDRCGGRLEARADDQPATIAHRLEVYERQTAPMLAHYRRQGILQTADGDQTIERLTDELGAGFRQAGLLA
ncbi:MAG: adenylate kinase [Omnitrophica WOR_2 bacterium RIFCSPHIGHO2_02_FULL_68_15]|nr:MAG: adenylate kinase [Omnitrophica WOR_2 bacterium RIFCSPHIGHO2_02_FULL_68_15]